MKTNSLLLGVVIVVIVAVVGLVAWDQFGMRDRYTAVYLRTGDLYFGKLVRFPHFGLRQPYLVQITKDGQPNLQRFKNVFWSPEDELKINRDEVVWYTNLSRDSQLVKLFTENPNLTMAPQQETASSSVVQPKEAPKQ